MRSFAFISRSQLWSNLEEIVITVFKYVDTMVIGYFKLPITMLSTYLKTVFKFVTTTNCDQLKIFRRLS